jgi:nitroimidazol reductase NimA-like FMN-containing flavoprotein (pyridoxamine 5'-phosphate oxidase superfamily)
VATPATALDQRSSAPDAQPVSWADTQRLLEAAETSWISTVRADGRPHVTPLVVVWSDGALYFHTGAGEQKFRNLQANPYVVLTCGSSAWTAGPTWWSRARPSTSPTRPYSPGWPGPTRLGF